VNRNRIVKLLNEPFVDGNDDQRRDTKYDRLGQGADRGAIVAVIATVEEKHIIHEHEKSHGSTAFKEMVEQLVLVSWLGHSFRQQRR
jgi:hypothetical protein